MVIDVEMAELDGMQCLERLKRLERPRTFASSSTPRSINKRQAVLEAGAHDFIPKGDPELLREALERLTGLERS